MIEIQDPDVLIAALLDSTTSHVLETMFFSTVIGSAPESESDSNPRLRARLSFSGNPSGEFEVETTRAAAHALAAAFLGIDESEVDAQQAEEVAGELANMACGSALSSLGNVECFRLAKPIVTSAPVGTPMLDGVRRGFLLDSGALRVSLRVDFPPA